ncbi:MAG: long-chain acyl-CoA synthetase [Pseudohongiellaceae bacterium]|jgi:long-chain acyl-CoA synthetase
MNVLFELLTGAVADRGTEPFLTDLRTSEVLSYDELLRRSRAFAHWLDQRGVGLGDRLAYVTKNAPAFYAVLFGCASRGVCLVPINEDSGEKEISYVLEDSGAEVVVCDVPGHGDWVLLEDELFSSPSEVQALDCESEQPAIMIYTSGTTGRSKGVVLSQKNLTAMSATLASVYGYQPGQRFLSMLPNYHINAPVVTGLSCIAGRTHVFVTDLYGFTNARLIFRFAEEHQLDVLSLTPSIMASLLKFNPDGPGCDLSSVKYALVGTAFLNEQLWHRFEDTFGIPCYQGYGLTETTTWATMTPPDERKRYDSAGVPIGCEVRIDEESGGEIQIAGEIVMHSYHKRNKLTKKSLKQGWFRTGDIGRIDDDGQLVVTGRIKNIIKRRGVLISPEEIDLNLRTFGALQDVATLGMADELFGERVLSACVLDEADLEGLQAHARRELSAYKLPDDFVVVSEIPKTSMGKPDLVELRALVGGERVAEVVKSFDIYKFRRARSDDLPAIETLLQKALLAGTSVEFVTFWGVGSRAEAAKPDRAAMDLLRRFLDAINKAAGRELATLRLVLADVHARCNQVDPSIYEPYFAAMGGLAEERGFTTSWLSAVWSEHELEFDEVLGQMQRNDRLEEWESFALRDEFLNQASNRCADPGQAEEFAYRYFLTITTENEAMAASCAGSVFITYNGADFRSALPKLPMVHLHSLKPGTAAKPWFLGDE